MRGIGLMTGNDDRRRPWLVAVALVAAIGAALVAPVLIGARKGEPIPGAFVRASSHESIAVTAPIPLGGSSLLMLERGTIALVDTSNDASHRGQLLRALTAGADADLVLDGAHLVVDRTGGSESSPVAAPPEDLRPIATALAGFKFRRLTILDSALAISAGDGPHETVSLVNMEMTPGRGGLVTARGQIEYRGRSFDVDLAFARPPSGNEDAPLRVRAAATGEGTSLSFDGMLALGERPRLTADNATLSVDDLRGFAAWLGMSWPPAQGLGPFAARGRLVLDERSASFEHAEFTLDGNKATGTLMVKLGAERPAIEGTLAFSSFDVTPYVSPSRSYALALVWDWIASRFPADPSAPSLLHGMDADIRLSAASVTSGSDRLGRAAASLSVRDGKLYGELAELELEQGGRGEAQFTVDATGRSPRYTIRAELRDMDLAAVASRLGPSAIEGRGDIQLDLSASGSSASELAKSLSGKLALDIDDGVRIGLDLDALAPAEPASVAPSAGWGDVGASTTSLSRLAARLTVDRGIVAADDVEAATGDNRLVTAAGQVDIDKGLLDLIVSFDPAPGAGGTAANAAAAARKAFKLEGSWTAPAITRTEAGKSAGSAALTGRNPG